MGVGSEKPNCPHLSVNAACRPKSLKFICIYLIFSTEDVRSPALAGRGSESLCDKRRPTKVGTPNFEQFFRIILRSYLTVGFNTFGVTVAANVQRDKAQEKT